MRNQSTPDRSTLTLARKWMDLLPDLPMSYWEFWLAHADRLKERFKKAMLPEGIDQMVAFEPYYKIEGLIVLGPKEVFGSSDMHEKTFATMPDVPWTIKQLTKLARLACKWETMAVLWRPWEFTSDLESIRGWSNCFRAGHEDEAEAWRRYTVFRQMDPDVYLDIKDKMVMKGLTIKNLANRILGETIYNMASTRDWRIGYLVPPSWSRGATMETQLALAKHHGLEVLGINEILLMQCLLDKAERGLGSTEAGWRTKTDINLIGAHLGLVYDHLPGQFSFGSRFFRLKALPDDGSWSFGLAVGGMPKSCL